MEVALCLVGVVRRGWGAVVRYETEAVLLLVGGGDGVRYSYSSNHHWRGQVTAVGAAGSLSPTLSPFVS